MKRLTPFAVAALIAAVTASGCGSDGSSGGPGASAATTQRLTVFAAASLRSTFTTLGQQFEQQHPGTNVALNFAGSSDLVTQITNGAPADVFASADTKNMSKLTDAQLVAGAPVAFATNTLTIVTPPDNPAKVASFSDLATPDTTVVVCAPQVPCGSATQRVEALTKTTLRPVSEESSVTDVLTKVTSGEADAGLVYVTDATAAGGKVRAVAFPEAAQAVNTYPIAVVGSTRQQQVAQQFRDYVTGPSAQQVLRDAGFGAP